MRVISKLPVFLTMLLLSSVTTAQEKLPLLCVLDLAWYGMSQTDTYVIEDYIAAHFSASGEYRVIDRRQRRALLDAVGESREKCIQIAFGWENAWIDEACQIEEGRLLSAYRVVVGSVVAIDTVNHPKLLTLKLMDVQTGLTLSTAKEVFSDLNAMVDGIADLVSVLLNPSQASSSTDMRSVAPRESGLLQWFYSTGGSISGLAIGSDGTIYVGSSDNRLYAINPNGTLKWFYTTGSSYFYPTPTLGADGTIYVGSADDSLYAINPNGTLKWLYTTGSSCSYPALGADGTIYISVGKTMHAIYPNGIMKWSYVTSEDLFSPPAIGADGSVYVGSQRSKLYAISADGYLKWTKVNVSTNATVGGDGRIYVGLYGGKLCSITPKNRSYWCYSGVDVYTTPVIGPDGTIFVVTAGGSLYAISPKDRLKRPRLKWSYAVGAGVYGTWVNDSDGTVFFGSWDGKLYALSPLGRLKWSCPIGTEVSSLAIGADGTIYVGSWDGKLYALDESALE